MSNSAQVELACATEAEVSSQPEVWQRVLDIGEDTLAPLPPWGATVLGIGCGTSYYILDSYARRRSALGVGVTRAAIATELDDPTTYDVVVLLSRSGITSDLLTIARNLASTTYTVCITASPGSALTEITHAQLLLDFANETSVVQTRFATSALTLLRRSLGDRVDQLSQQAATVLAEPLRVDPSGYDHLVFLGTGWTYGLAQEAALKCQESALLWTEAHALHEYRHGPIACANKRTLVWSFDPVPSDLRKAVEQTGATICVADGDPQVELVRVHRAAIAFARLRGINADAPPHLTRAIVHS